MRVRYHKGFGHGLRPGTNRDINCGPCKDETAAGTAPVITGRDDGRPLTLNFPGCAPLPVRGPIITEIPAGA